MQIFLHFFSRYFILFLFFYGKSWAIEGKMWAIISINSLLHQYYIRILQYASGENPHRNTKIYLYKYGKVKPTKRFT